MTRLIINGRIYLGRGNYAQSLLIENGYIAKTGNTRDLLRDLPLGAEQIDAEGSLVLPAFYDSHLHLMWVGRRFFGIECSGARSIDEIIQLGKETIKKLNPAPGNYIIGAGVNPALFTQGEIRELCREDIDKISTEYPIILSRHCGHTIFANSLALKMAGFSESAPDVDGGTIEKDSTGRPTGVFKENANGLLRKPMPPPSQNDLINYIKQGMKKIHSLGITSCGSYDTGGLDYENTVDAYRNVFNEFKAQGKPGVRVTMQCGITLRDDILDLYIARNNYLEPLWQDPLWGNFLKTGSIKIFADGTLGGQTAWMKQPYCDKPGTYGFPLMDQEKLEHFVKKAAGEGMQVLIHAIGNAGIESVINAYEKVTGHLKNPLRHGIIHCQITTPDLLERMAKNKILALVQPAFLADDIHVLEQRVGPELASTSYAWGEMGRLGIPVSYGTDAPVSPLNPLFGIEWAMKRGVDIYGAFDAYTTHAAFANHDDGSLGRIHPSYRADLVFLDKDIFSIPKDQITGASVLRTICAGETVYAV